jgi:hypothetical protein
VVDKDHNGTAVPTGRHGGAGREIHPAEIPDCPGNSGVETAP